MARYPSRDRKGAGRRLRIALGIPDHPRPRQADRVVEAGVAGPVHHDGVAPAGECRDDAQVGHVPGREDEGGPGAHEPGEVGLQGLVGLGVTRDEAAGARAPAPSVDGAACGLLDSGVAGQAQVIVGGELEDRPAAQADVRPGGRPHRHQVPQQAAGTEVVEGAADEIGVGHGPRIIHAARAVASACRAATP